MFDSHRFIQSALVVRPTRVITIKGCNSCTGRSTQTARASLMKAGLFVLLSKRTALKLSALEGLERVEVAPLPTQ